MTAVSGKLRSGQIRAHFLELAIYHTTGRLGYIGPTMLREYVGRTTSRTTGRATCCTMDHATDRATQRCMPLLRHRAVGPADVQRWIHTYGDRGTVTPRVPGAPEVMTPTCAAGDQTRSAEVCYTAGLNNAGCSTPTGEGGAARA